MVAADIVSPAGQRFNTRADYRNDPRRGQAELPTSEAPKSISTLAIDTPDRRSYFGDSIDRATPALKDEGGLAKGVGHADGTANAGPAL
jgi:hypothetical protein